MPMKTFIAIATIISQQIRNGSVTQRKNLSALASCLGQTFLSNHLHSLWAWHYLDRHSSRLQPSSLRLLTDQHFVSQWQGRNQCCRRNFVLWIQVPMRGCQWAMLRVSSIGLSIFTGLYDVNSRLRIVIINLRYIGNDDFVIEFTSGMFVNDLSNSSTWF